MADLSKIEWTDASWNPVTGCDEVSPGCDHCYAKTFAERWRGVPGHHFERGFDVVLRPERLDQPLRWAKPRRIFVNSMSDLFHDSVPDEFIAKVFAVMAAARQHTFQLLTKRHGRMRSLLTNDSWRSSVFQRESLLDWGRPRKLAGLDYHRDLPVWPLPNVWLGVSVENQKWANIRIPALLSTPAAVRWLSCEPLLGPVDLRTGCYAMPPDGQFYGTSLSGIDWVVVGGESGRGARPMHPDWARFVRDQCASAGVPFFFKQWGEHVPASVEDDSNFAGGRAYNHPLGGRHAAFIVLPGKSGTYRAATSRAMRPGDRTKGAELLDADTIALRVGKTAAGRELDGRTHDAYPQAVSVG